VKIREKSKNYDADFEIILTSLGKHKSNVHHGTGPEGE
jgi:hypothetical protein